MVRINQFFDTTRNDTNTIPDLPKETAAARRLGRQNELHARGRDSGRPGHGIGGGRGWNNQRNIALMLPHVRRAVELTCDTVTISDSGDGDAPFTTRIRYWKTLELALNTERSIYS